jgi:ribosomal protein S18 acetylase RimI-like enzyme
LREKPRTAEHAGPGLLTLTAKPGDAQTASVIVIEATRRAPDFDDAAQIWAEATAARDGQGDVPGLDISRPVIQGVLDRSGRALLMIARTAGDVAGGFAVTELLDGVSTTRAQVSYLGVRPGLRGQGIGERLLRELRSQLRATGFTHAELSVYLDNTRAIALYERLGWLPLGGPVSSPDRKGRATLRTAPAARG